MLLWVIWIPSLIYPNEIIFIECKGPTYSCIKVSPNEISFIECKGTYLPIHKSNGHKC